MANEKCFKLSKSVWIVLLLLVILPTFLFSQVFSLLSTNTVIRSSGRIGLISPLHVDGRWIKNAEGDIVVLRGVNCGGFADAPGGIWSGIGIQSYADFQSNHDLVVAQLDAIKSWGSNCIRIMYAAEYWVYNIGNHRQVVKDLASLCAARGIYVIYEGWCIRGYGNGAAQDELPYPPYQSSTNAEEVIPSEQAYVDMMVSQATELGVYDNILFGLWNEPTGNFTSWIGVMQQAITAIRNAGIESIILCQRNFALWVNIDFPPPPAPTLSEYTDIGAANTLQWIYEYPLEGTNIAYQAHIYDPAGRDATYEEVKMVLNYSWVPYVTFNMSKPIIMGEVGANLVWTGQDLTNEISQFRSTLQILNEWNIGYVGWEWRSIAVYPLITSDFPNYTASSSGEILRNHMQAIPYS